MADFSQIVPGLEGTAQRKADPVALAPAVGSGRAPVFASPSMVALMEAAAVAAVDHLLPGGHQTLGTHLDVAHVAATPEGLSVTATAILRSVEGRKLTFAVEARDDVELIGKGTHTRVIVDDKRFLARLDAKRPAASD